MVDAALKGQHDSRQGASAVRRPPLDKASSRGVTVEVLWGLLTAAAAVMAAVWDLRLDRASLHIPLVQGSDTNFGMTIVKTMVEHGWIYSAPGIGAPTGTDFYDYSVGLGETFHFIVLRALSLVSSDPVAIINVFFVLGYPAAALSAFAVLRALGVQRTDALLGALLYTMLPFHALRNEGHLTLSAYYAVPLGCWLALGAMGYVRLFARRIGEPRRLRGWLSVPTLVTVTLSVIVATATLYYALFALTIIALSAPVAYLAHRDRGRLAGAAVVGCIIFAVTVAQQLPGLIYRASHGVNSAVGTRSPSESEFYGLKIAYMLLPRPGHRIDAFSRLGSKYAEGNILPGEGFSPNLGVLLSLGLLASVVALLSGGLRGRDAGSGGSRDLRLLACAGLGSTVAIAVATVGGGSALFAYLVSAQIRAWDRISVFIAFFAVLSLCLGLGWLRARLSAGPRWRVGVLVVAVGLLGLLDQTTRFDRLDSVAAATSWRGDARFVRAVEGLAPSGGQVLQLPYVPFPENPPVVNMNDYDQFKGYIHSSKLKWSYGAMKGRPSDWLAGADTGNLAELVPAAVAAGFDGIWVDQNGYVDHGDAVAAKLSKMVGIEHAILSDDKRLAYWDLRAYGRALAARTDGPTRAEAGHAIVRPPFVEEGAGLGGRENDGKNPFYWAGPDARLEVVNEVGHAEPIDITAVLATPTPTPARVTIAWPGGLRQTLTIGSPRPIRLRATLPPGRSEVHFTTDGPPGAITPADKRDRRLQIVNLRFTDASVDRLEREAAATR